MTAVSKPSLKAAKVRERRAHQARRPLGTRRAAVGGRGARPAAKAPVFMRGSKAALPVRGRVGSKTRRRYELALGNTGAEIRLPALPQVRLSWQWFSGSLAVVVLGLGYFLWTAPAYQVGAAEVIGVQRLTSADVNLALRLAAGPVFAVNPGLIRDRLAQMFPEFARIEVEVSWPNRLVIAVEERVPVVAWQLGNSTTWIDAEGVAFPPRGEAGELVQVQALGALPVPLDSEGIPAPQKVFMEAEMLVAVQAVHTVAPADAVLLYDPNHGLGWQDPQGWAVYLGSAQEMALKLQIYQALAKRLKKDDIQPVLISVEYVYAPFYRLER